MLMRRLRPKARLTTVEIDRRVLRLARRRFDLDAREAEILEGDGLEFLARTRRRFDLVIDDMFGAGPKGLERPVLDETAHLKLITRRLNWAGVAVTNSTSDDDPPDLERGPGFQCIAIDVVIDFDHRVRGLSKRWFGTS